MGFGLRAFSFFSRFQKHNEFRRSGRLCTPTPEPNNLGKRLALLILSMTPLFCRAGNGEWFTTIYGAAIATQPGWEDIIIDAPNTRFVDSYLVTLAMSRQYAERKQGALSFEAEGQIVKHFGDQTHWEFNAVPVVLRWHRFPWSKHVATSAAFGLGLSYATELPPVEVLLEGESHQWLVYWVLEMTGGPVDSRWAVSLRIHHRSVAYGLMGDQGGANAVGLGVRYRLW